MKTYFKIFLFCFSTLLLIGCDRATKDMAKEQLRDKQPLTYFHDTVRLEYVENTGAAMSLGDGLSKRMSFWLLSILPLLFLLILSVYVVKKFNRMSHGTLFFCSLLLAGGLGNILDRIQFDRHVTDFMNLGFRNFRTGIFNFADVYVTVGVIGFFFLFRKVTLSSSGNQ